MKKILLVLSVAVLSLTSCSKEEVSCECGTIKYFFNSSESHVNLMMTSQCEEDLQYHTSDGPDSEKWTTSIYVPKLVVYGYVSGDTYCSQKFLDKLTRNQNRLD